MHFIGEISALITAILWAVSSYFFSNAINKIGSLSVNFLRLLISLLLLIPTIFIFNIWDTISLRQIILLMASGIVGLSIGDALFFKSLEYLSPRIGTLVTSLSPAVSAIMAYFFLSERISLINVTGIVIALSGVMLVVFKKEENTGNAKNTKELNKGLLYAFLYTLGQGGGIILARFAYDEKPVNSITATAVRIFPAALVLLPFFLLKVKTFRPKIIFQNDVKIFKDVFTATVLSAYIGMVLMLVSVTQTSIAVASTIMGTVPIIQLLISKYYFKDRLTFRSYAGAIINVAGIIILFWH
jgi:drug/metabolite transporter (DMT)-like permease